MPVLNYGKILFYNESTGDGIIVTQDIKKIPFTVSNWNDFDNLPQMGLNVEFKIDNEAAVEIAFYDKSIEPEKLAVNAEEIPSIIHTEKVTTQGVINDYFGSVYENLISYRHFNSTEYTIDFGILRRFLLTTYNNLIEMDRDLKQSDLTDIYKKLLSLSEIYDAFKQKTKYVKRAFRELFLNRHHEYTGANQKLEVNIDLIGKYDIVINMADTAIKKLDHVLKHTPSDSQNYTVIQKKLKSARAKSIDAIHHKRELEEENIQLIKFLEMIVHENEENFRALFVDQAKIYDDKIVVLLNKVAYVFDTMLWQKARKSKQVREYFKRSDIKGQLTSLTYLQYYLQSLNSEKLSKEHQELFDILPYLQSLQTRTIVYLSTTVDNVMRMKYAVSSVGKGTDLESTLNYETALASIIKKVPNFIFIDKDADFKKLIKILSELDILDETYIVLVVETMDEKLLERAKKLYIQDFAATQVSANTFADTIARIIEG